jgi:hypothetical protein
MNKRNILASLAGAMLLSCCGPVPAELPMSVAHRGCWLKDGNEFYINENCPAGIRMAALYDCGE